MNKPAIILASGGLDSTTCLAIAKHEGLSPLYSMSFDYGQRHRHELTAAEKIATHFGVREHRVIKIDLRQFGKSALTDDIAVPKDRDETAMSADIPVTYVPARNTIFLSYALAWAEVLNCDDVFIGVNALDFSGYPDCRPDFIASFQQTARLGTKRTHFTIHAPLQHLTKAQIIRRGMELNVDYSMTHSCYDPDARGRACGRCDSCLLRKKGFAEAGVADPTQYVATNDDSQSMIDELRDAAKQYDFPSVAYDFRTSTELRFRSMLELEEYIRHELLADDLDRLRDGLASVVYWGNVRAGYRLSRANEFRNGVTRSQLSAAQALFRRIEGPGIRAISNLGMPQLTRMSFVSKVRMFLNPVDYVVLDMTLLGLRKQFHGSPFDAIVCGTSETSMRCSSANEGCYERWSALCRELAKRCWGQVGRAVDVERAIFSLIDHGKSETARRLLTVA